MSSTKAGLKSIKAKLQGHEPEGALYEATQLLKSIGDKDPEAPTVLAFRALALTQLDRIDEAEKSYLTALKLAPGHQFALPGLKKLYTTKNRYDDLGRLLEISVQSAYDEGDAEKVSAAMQEVVQHRHEHGPEDRMIATLRLLVPSSPLVPLIQSAAVPQGSYVPLQAPKYPPANQGEKPPAIPNPLPHVHYLAGSLPLVLYLLLRVQAEVYTTTEAKVKAGRMRVGARGEKDVRRTVDAEVLAGPLGSQMINLLRDVAAHPSVEEDLRRDAEIQEFKYWRRLVSVLQPEGKEKQAAKPPPKAPAKGGMMISASLPPKPSAALSEDANTPPLFRAPEVPKVTKVEARERVDGLADGFVLLEVGGDAEDAWSWVIEGRDEPTVHYDHDLLLKFAKVFPKSPFTDFIDDYARLYKLALPEPEEEESAPPPESSRSPSPQKKVRYRRPPKKNKRDAENARARRKARREQMRAGELEDLAEEEREELVASMTKLLERLKGSIFAHRVMARVALQEEDWSNAISYAERARKLVREVQGERGVMMVQTRASLDECLGVALVPYYPPKHHTRAARLLNDVLKTQPGNYPARFGIARIMEWSGDWAGAQAEFQRLLDQGGDDKEMTAAKEELGWCLVNQGELIAGRDVLEEVVELRDTRKEEEGKDDEGFVRARAWWRLGRTEWMIGSDEARTQAEEWFMASLRADASFAASYTALGICYAEAHSPPDTERALKCFQKAFELDATEADAARRLAYGYADEEEWAQVRAIAMRVMEGEGGVEGVAGGDVVNAAGRFAPTNGWAWKALGSTEMYYKQYAKAIQAFQVALRADPDDASMWRMLGEAYVKSGRQMAGLKALQKALELDPNMWMAHYHIGETYMQLGDYSAAIAAYEQIEVSVGGLGITAALAEATLALGRVSAAGGFRERSRRAFHSAITYTLQALSGGSHRAWGWKVIGDACLALAEREVEAADVASTAAILHPVLEHLVLDDEDRRSAVTGLGHASNLLQSPPGSSYAVQVAVFAMAYRAHLLKNEHSANSALYDLGCALHTLALRSPTSSEKKTAATKAAIRAIRTALDRDASDERLWNALGVICAAAGPQLAQHAFVVSLELYAKDADVWTNLGYLYLTGDDRELANQCFLRAQTLDPDCARAWFGQAVLAQRDGDPAAAGLFAHAATLSNGSLLEADLALALGAYAPFATRASPPNVAPLHQAAFALARYVAAHPADAGAKHLQALVAERLGLTDIAVRALQAATALFEEEFEATESADIEAKYAAALLNLARVRLTAGEYKGALEAFNDAAELVNGESVAQAKLGAAVAHFWLEDLDASLDAFQAALQAAKNDDELTDEIAVLFARTLWGVGGDDAADAAKTQLMESLEHESPSLKVIATLGAAALASSDGDLLDAALSELTTRLQSAPPSSDPGRTADAVLSTAALVRGDESAAISALEGAAAQAPWDAVLRNRLAGAYVASGRTGAAIALLQPAGVSRSPEEAARADAMRGVALTLDGDGEEVDQEGQVTQLAGTGRRSLMRAVKLTPWDTGAWEALAWARRAEVELDN